MNFESLPERFRSQAVKLGDEYAWPKTAALELVNYLESKQLAISGIEIWKLEGTIPSLQDWHDYWTFPSKNWPNNVTKNAEQARTLLAQLFDEKTVFYLTWEKKDLIVIPYPPVNPTRLTKTRISQLKKNYKENVQGIKGAYRKEYLDTSSPKALTKHEADNYETAFLSRLHISELFEALSKSVEPIEGLDKLRIEKIRSLIPTLDEQLQRMTISKPAQKFLKSEFERLREGHEFTSKTFLEFEFEDQLNDLMCRDTLEDYHLIFKQTGNKYFDFEEYRQKILDDDTTLLKTILAAQADPNLFDWLPGMRQHGTDQKYRWWWYIFEILKGKFDKQFLPQLDTRRVSKWSTIPKTLDTTPTPAALDLTELRDPAVAKKQQELVVLLRSRIPEYPMDKLAELRDSPYIVFGDFGSFLIHETEKNDNSSVVKRSFKLLDEMASSKDSAVANLALVVALEVFIGFSETEAVVRSHLKNPESLKNFEELIQDWKDYDEWAKTHR